LSKTQTSPVTAVSRDRIESKDQRHRVHASLPIRAKVRILLELRWRDLPLLAKQRPLRVWQKPPPE
jgi:hypothetical protein